MAQFIPRAIFPSQLSLPRSYFLGHHAAGLAKMKTMLTQIDLIIECRDYRVPLTSLNPLFEQALAGRERVVVYTKRDLGSQSRPSDRRVCSTPGLLPFRHPFGPGLLVLI
jgi:ribosome biogenesis GTPase A